MPGIDTVALYIATFPYEVQARMQRLRAIIRESAPGAVESISYKMPAYKLNGKPLVYFAAYEHHIGLYATPVGYEPFQAELARFKRGKGSVQFPHDEPLPLDLIQRMVAFRIETVQDQTA